MGMPAEHIAQIRRTGFPIPPAGEFDDQERDLLGRYGYWLAALADGTLTPVTPDQEQFVRVARGETEPRSAFEVAWVKYCHTLPTAKTPVGPLELADRFGRLQTARAAAAVARDEYSARRVAVLEQVRSQLDALDAEFAEVLAGTGSESARLEAEAREAVLAYGASFRHAGVHAVYARGRVTWDTQGLSRYMETHPEVEEFRRVGASSVSLRYSSPDPVATPAQQPSGDLP